MTDEPDADVLVVLRDDLRALAEQVGHRPLDLSLLQGVAARRRRRRRAAQVLAATTSLLVVAGLLVAVPHLRGSDADSLAVATTAPAAGPDLVPTVTGSTGDSTERARLLGVADAQARTFGGTAQRVVAVHADRAGVARLTGSEPGSDAGEDLWVLDVTGSSYVCGPSCFVVTSPPPSGSHLRLVVGAGPTPVDGVGLSDLPLVPGTSDVVSILRG